MQHKDAPHIKTKSPTAANYLIAEINKSYSKELSSTEKQALSLPAKTKNAQDQKKTTDTIINKLFNTLWMNTLKECYGCSDSDIHSSPVLYGLPFIGILAIIFTVVFACGHILPWTTALLIISLSLLAQAIPFLICVLLISTRVSITKHTAASNYLKANKTKEIEMVSIQQTTKDEKEKTPQSNVSRETLSATS